MMTPERLQALHKLARESQGADDLRAGLQDALDEIRRLQATIAAVACALIAASEDDESEQP